MDREELMRKYAGGERDFTSGIFRGSHWQDEIVRELFTNKPTSPTPTWVAAEIRAEWDTL